MLTSSDEIRDMNEAYRLGANSFLVKPTDFEDLTEVLRKLKPGDVVTVTILRNEERKQVKLKLMALR